MSRNTNGHSRALQLVEANLRQELRERASAHALDLGTFHFAEAAMRSLELTVTDREAALRTRLSDVRETLDPAMLLLFHAALADGRQEHHFAAQVADKAEADLDASRDALYQTLKRRSVLKDVRRQRTREDSLEESKRQAFELDALWLQSRYGRP